MEKVRPEISIGILASHNLVIEGVRRIIEHGPVNAEVMLGINSVHRIIEYNKAHPLDLLILIHFRVGLKVLKQIKHFKTVMPDTKLLLVNMVHNNQSVYRALQQGMDAYVTRGNLSSELNHAISQILMGNTPYMNNNLFEKLHQFESDMLKKKMSMISYPAGSVMLSFI